MKKSISLLVIEDNRLLRDRLATILNEQADFKVRVAVPSDDPTATRIGVTQPTVVLVDVGLRDRDCVQLVETLKRQIPDAKVIVLDLVPGERDVLQLVKAGVSGFTLKDATAEELVATIRSVADGRDVLPPTMTRSLFSQIAAGLTPRGTGPAVRALRLTQREREIIDLISEGLSNKEIAQRLHIATHTVKSHVHSVLEKLALHTRLQIAAFAHDEDSSRSA